MFAIGFEAETIPVMANLNQKAQRQVFEVLEESELGSANFHVTFPDSSTLLTVNYADNKDYSFDVTDYTSKVMEVRYWPGEFKTYSSEHVDSFSKVLELLEVWCGLVLEDITASNPLFAQLEKAKQDLSAKIDTHIANNERFTKAEIEELHTKLSDLVSKFEELHAKSVITETELKEIKETLENLETKAHDVPKKTWYRSVGSKVIELTGRVIQSPQGQKMLTDVNGAAYMCKCGPI